MNRVMSQLGIPAILSILLAACSPSADESANKLYVETQQSVASITPDMPEGEVAAVLRSAEQNLKRLLTDYPSSQLAVTLASSGAIGDLSPTKLAEDAARYEAIAALPELETDSIAIALFGLDEDTYTAVGPWFPKEGDVTLIKTKTDPNTYRVQYIRQHLPELDATYQIEKVSRCVYNVTYEGHLALSAGNPKTLRMDLRDLNAANYAPAPAPYGYERTLSHLSSEVRYTSAGRRIYTRLDTSELYGHLEAIAAACPWSGGQGY